ncbi:MAG: 16S rRNA (cytidine(1402)-2'-O)-methyltransferase [Desulfobacterales bacterium]|nr:MAG: 16S rRNA (cytidine(1402)-2'-O)-methyltransferase [Desulfobacterales bacterium]
MKKKTEKKPGTGSLYLVPTPIGNLEDITLRGLRILREVDCIAAEDTRHSRKLLDHYGITTPLTSYYREKEQRKSEQLLGMMLGGKDIALISDAGTPCISDPGAVLVEKAYLAGIEVIPLPGASALTTALSASGYAGNGFLFVGFAPPKTGKRKKLLTTLRDLQYPVVFYESPQRVEALLKDALEILGDRDIFWAREITKAYQDLQHSRLEELLNGKKPQIYRGEFVIILFPGTKEKPDRQSVEERICWYRDNSELSLKDMSRKLATELGVPRSEIYKQALSLYEKDERSCKE